MRKSADQDTVTQLPTRKYLEEQLTLKLETSETAPYLALLHFDIIRFKMIKYTLGYQIAEELLVQITETLQSHLPKNSILAKISSDEFAILIEGIETIEQGKHWAEYFLQLLISPFAISGHQLFTQIKAGLVLSWQWQRSAKDLLQGAEIAVQEAKLSTTQNYAIFNPQMQASAIARLQLDNEMRDSLAQERFQLYYQPIVALDTGEIRGFEALLRWQKEGQWLSPETFIPVAEETGFIIALDRWVLRQACQQMQQWRLQWQVQFWVSVNISAVELIQPHFLDEMDSILAETGLPPEQLKLEITETTVMKNAEQVTVILQELKARKIRLCLDDFGTGYSSLSYLREFPFDVIKIDRSFVSQLETDSINFNLIQAMTLLANHLNLGTIVEGIETAEQLELLKQLSCQQGQGYLFARSLPPSEVEALLAQDNRIIS